LERPVECLGCECIGDLGVAVLADVEHGHLDAVRVEEGRQHLGGRHRGRAPIRRVQNPHLFLLLDEVNIPPSA
jgi:hypothetical protein